jgi:uncharacterized protein YqjF (DUF2071 family)
VLRPGDPIQPSDRDIWLTGRWRAYTRRFGILFETPVEHEPWPLVLAAADGDDDGAIHGDDVNRAFQAAFVGGVARWSSRCRVVVGEVPGRRRHGGAGLRTCEGAA